MRIVIELKRDARPQQIIGILNKHTAMRSRLGQHACPVDGSHASSP